MSAMIVALIDRVYFGVFSLLLYIYDWYVRSAHSALATHSVVVSWTENILAYKALYVPKVNRNIRIFKYSCMQRFIVKTHFSLCSCVCEYLSACASPTARVKCAFCCCRCCWCFFFFVFFFSVHSIFFLFFLCCSFVFDISAVEHALFRYPKRNIWKWTGERKRDGE